MARFWVGVVSESHVKLAVDGGFAQVCHGKKGPLGRMKAGDYILYYSPKTDMKADQPLQAFTAAGKMLDDKVYPFQMAEDFIPYRRGVFYYQPVRSCPIELARQHPEWKDYASQLRYGLFEVSKDFYLTIFNEMKL